MSVRPRSLFQNQHRGGQRIQLTIQNPNSLLQFRFPNNYVGIDPAIANSVPRVYEQDSCQVHLATQWIVNDYSMDSQ